MLPVVLRSSGTSTRSVLPWSFMLEQGENPVSRLMAVKSELFTE